MRVHDQRVRGNRHKLIQVKFCLNTRKKFFVIGTIKYWTGSPREMGKSLLEIFQAHIDRTLDNVNQGFAFKQMMDQKISRCPL